MFSSKYQGGAAVEVFSGQGKDPVAKWKLSGGSSAIHKEYNKEVKGYVYCLEGSSQTVKMQMPENGKTSLGLLQRFLVLQVNIPQCKDVSIELVITDSAHLKRRLHISTVHKELSATILHARIPFVGLKRNIWSTVCIDLVSFAAELFKGFLTLDGITLFATCRVRRIFTMKVVPTGMANEVMYLGGAGLMDTIPRSCHFPPHVHHVTQMLSMKNLWKTDESPDRGKFDCVPDQADTDRSTRNHQTRPQGDLRTASGATASAPPRHTGRKSRAAIGRMDRNKSPSSRVNQKIATESQSMGISGEDSSHGEPYPTLQEGAPGRSQPRPPTDQRGSGKLPVLGAGRERPASSGANPGRCRKSSESWERRTPPSSRPESRPLTPTYTTELLTADDCMFSLPSSRTAPTHGESVPCSTRPVPSSDLQAWRSWENNEGSEPQLTLQEEVFRFSSQPRSPKRGQGQGDREEMEMGDGRAQSTSGRRCEAQLEDDFIGSESDEDKSYPPLQRQRSDSSLATSRTPDPAWHDRLQVHPGSHDVDQRSPNELHSALGDLHVRSETSGRAESADVVPARCLSPGATAGRQERHGVQCASEVAQEDQVPDGNSAVTLSKSLLQEVKSDGATQEHMEEDERPGPVDSSRRDLHVRGSLRMHGEAEEEEEEERRMLASLRREQAEEEECRASGLSASQIHRCNVSVSSVDTATWTRIAMPANQGHHYQNEMNPLLHSNPREWMDVLSPPIVPPSPPRRSGNARNELEKLVGGSDECVNEEEHEDDYLNLLYDPCLNCYFDPKTGKYYELA